MCQPPSKLTEQIWAGVSYDGKINSDKEKNKVPFRHVQFSVSLRCKRNFKNCHLHKAQACIRESKQSCLNDCLFALLSALWLWQNWILSSALVLLFCTEQYITTRLFLFFKIKSKTTKIHNKVRINEKNKTYNQFFSLPNILNICHLQTTEDAQSETDCIMVDSSKVSLVKACLHLKFSYLGFNFQPSLHESASSNFLIATARLKICPSAIV